MSSSIRGSIALQTEMSLAAWMLLPLLLSSAWAYPAGIDANLGLDANVGLDASLGAGGYGFGQGLRGWPYDNYGTLTQNSLLDYANPLAYGAEVYAASPYVYESYPRSVDYARENYVRRFPVASEVGIRDQFSVRPTYPYSRYYATYFPYNYYGWRNAIF